MMEDKNIVEEIKKFVGDECKKHSLGREILANHFIPVVNYAKKLSKNKNVDPEIVEISAWLHDIGSIIFGRSKHHITGAKIAEKKLRELNYPEEKIKKVKKCILNHRGSIKSSLEAPEEKIIAEADCLTFFDNLEGYLLWVIDAERIKNQKKIRDSVRRKSLNKWNQLSPEGKELVLSKYKATMLLFENENANRTNSKIF